MFPTLGHFFSRLFAIDVVFPLPTYGFLLASAFLSAFLIIRHELKRKAKIGLIKSTYEKVIKGKPAKSSELITSGFFGFLIGFKLFGIIFNYDLFVKDVQYYILSLEGSFFGGLITAAVFILYNYYNKHKNRLPEPVEEQVEVKPHHHSATILLVAAISGIIGAKIFHQLENFQEFLNDPIGSLFSTGGLTFYGGLIFGIIAVSWFIKSKKIHYSHMMDVAAPAVMLAYAIGRLGCMASGDGCWGVVNTEPKPEWLFFLPDWAWAFDFPHNVIKSGVEMEGCLGAYCYVLDKPVWPTPLYESVASLIFFAVLWGVRKHIQVPGVLFSIFLIMNGVSRFFIEKIRVNEIYKVAGFEFTQAELISVILVVAGVIGIIFFRKKYVQSKNTVSVQ